MHLEENRKLIFFTRFFLLALCTGCLYCSICWFALDQFCFVETSLVILSVFYVYVHLTRKSTGVKNNSLKAIIKNLILTFYPKKHLYFTVFLSIVIIMFFTQNVFYWLFLFVLTCFYSLSLPFLKIRNNPIGKPLFISLCWTLILFEPVLRMTDFDFQIYLSCIVFLHFFYFFILSVIDDVKDISIVENEFKSLPVKYDFEKVRIALIILLIVFYISSLFFKPLNNLSFVFFDFLLFASLFVFVFSVKKLSHTHIWLIELHLGFLGLEYFFLA